MPCQGPGTIAESPERLGQRSLLISRTAPRRLLDASYDGKVRHHGLTKLDESGNTRLCRTRYRNRDMTFGPGKTSHSALVLPVAIWCTQYGSSAVPAAQQGSTRENM